MGTNISLETIPENIDQETFKKICGDRYDNELYDAIKNPATGFVSKALFLKELSTKTHVFLTHDWGMDEQGRDNHGRVAKVNKWLKAHNIVTWFDEDRMKGNILQQMFQGIDNSRYVDAAHVGRWSKAEVKSMVRAGSLEIALVRPRAFDPLLDVGLGQYWTRMRQERMRRNV